MFGHDLFRYEVEEEDLFTHAQTIIDAYEEEEFDDFIEGQFEFFYDGAMNLDLTLLDSRYERFQTRKYSNIEDNDFTD